MISGAVIPLELQVPAAGVLDVLFGDPRWLPHPVQLIAALAVRFEKRYRKVFRSERTAGVATWVSAMAVVSLVLVAVLKVMYSFAPLAGDLVSIFLLYTAFAARGLVSHVLAVHSALEEKNLPLARKRVGMICGRSTDTLDEEGVARAAVESMAENISDGIVAPLFFAVLGGPVLAIMYKAVNTLDSMFGYKTTGYVRFGWFSARADDVLNFVPARISGWALGIAAFLTGLNGKNALKVLFRDSGNHASPNAGYPEAAVAGALDIRLGGPNTYFGEIVDKPYIFAEGGAVSPDHIKKAVKLSVVSTLLCLAVFLSIRFVI
jgi:adenosylcobinamide-phosphate synthase